MIKYFYLIFFPIALIAQTATAPSPGGMAKRGIRCQKYALDFYSFTG